jgi:hypothetical protein
MVRIVVASAKNHPVFFAPSRANAMLHVQDVPPNDA